MATVTSANDGDWDTAGTWDSGVPGDNDDVVINGHDVGFDVADQCKSLTVKGDGKFTLEEDLTFTDASGAGLTIEDDGNFDTDATASTPRKIKSASSTPTNKWSISVEDVVGTDSRTLNFDYVKFEGNKFYLGNDDYNVEMNTGSEDDPIVSAVTPPLRVPRLVEHEVEDRDYGRVYRAGASAAVLTITGTCKATSWLALYLDQMEKSGKRISFFSQRYHLPRCRVERPSFVPTAGGFYEHFTVTLRQDE